MLCRLLSVRTEVRCRLVSDYVYEEHAWLEVQIFMKGTDEEARHLDEMIDTALTVRSALAVRPERSHTGAPLLRCIPRACGSSSRPIHWQQELLLLLLRLHPHHLSRLHPGGCCAQWQSPCYSISVHRRPAT